ncbi:MAG TPA: hypothetical protein PLK12_11385 [Prolixibacteraceae bacterium]|nr:hypothetical protein [Prolixibacteraceae bacterium]
MKKNLFAIGGLVLVTGLILAIAFKPFVLNPNSFLFQKSGDALKSYYNLSYMLRYDNGIKHEGINYPYGEHVQFDNTHPVHLAFFKQIDKLIPVSNYGVAIVNLSMILSIILAVPFLFLILRRYRLPVWYAFVMTLIILFLSPQLDRIKGHFEMTYVFFIPLVWFLLLKFNDGKKTGLWAGLLLVTGILGGFTAAYFVAFYAIFLLAFVVARLWIDWKNRKALLRPSLVLLLLAVLPLLAVRGFGMATDWVSDRPDHPYGFYVYHANIMSVFMPFEDLVRIFSGSTYDNLQRHWEGKAFVGLPALLLAIFFVASVLKRFYTRRKIAPVFSENELNPYLLGAFLVLLFSMCFPFKWGLGFLSEWIAPLRQFRSLGRFAWIFYFIFTVYSATYLYRWIKAMYDQGSKQKAAWLLTLILLFWAYDAVAHTRRSFRDTIHNNDKLESSGEDYVRSLQEAGIDPDRYQAIFFLPFANTTGDKFQFDRGMMAFGEAMKCSYHTRLPLIQSYAPRLSFSHALGSVQILADSCIRKTRFDDMNDRPILLICTTETLNPEEQWLKDHSRELFANPWITISEFTPEMLASSYQSWKEHANSVKTTLPGTDRLRTSADPGKIWMLSFDDKKAEQVFHGDGALFKRRKSIDVFSENFAKKGMTGNYELSFWMYFDTRKYNMPEAFVEEIDKYGLVVETIILNTRQEHNVYERWVRIDQKLELKEGMRYRLWLKGKYITIDDLLLKPSGESDVWVAYPDGREMFNNYPL